MKFDERRTAMKIAIGLLAAAILGTGGFAFASGIDDTQPARTVSLPGTTTGGTTGTTTGTTTAANTAATTTDDIVIGDAPAATTTTGVDISGPCDEAEHANDPRCTGAVTDDRDDANSGPGSGDEDDDDDDDNSGPGSGDDNGDDHDNSGHGSGNDNDDD
jgi:hypothetical protein